MTYLVRVYQKKWPKLFKLILLCDGLWGGFVKTCLLDRAWPAECKKQKFSEIGPVVCPLEVVKVSD